MADIFDKAKRSEIMSRISSKETKQEILVQKFLFANGYRIRKNDSQLPGNPDVVLPKYMTVIFVHACFWHGHKGCKRSKLPETRGDFWEVKVKSNAEQDFTNTSELGLLN